MNIDMKANLMWLVSDCGGCYRVETKNGASNKFNAF